MLLLALHCIKSLRIWPDYPILFLEVVIFFIGFFPTLCNPSSNLVRGQGYISSAFLGVVVWGSRGGYGLSGHNHPEGSRML